jgi:hypothetical protein
LVAFSMRMLGRCSITPAAVVALNISNEQYMNILARWWNPRPSTSKCIGMLHVYMYDLRMFDNVKTHADRYCTFPSHMAAVGLIIHYYCGIVILPPCRLLHSHLHRDVRAIRLICATRSIHCSMPSSSVGSSTSPAREDMMQLGLCTSTSHQVVMRLIHRLWDSVIYLKRARCLFLMPRTWDVHTAITASHFQ